MEFSTEKHPSSHVLQTPIWILVIRGFQILISLVVLALAADVMSRVYVDEFGLAVATAVITWAAVFYIVATEKITDWQQAYHVVAVLALEAFLVIMWLTTFAAAAARRALHSASTGSSNDYVAFSMPSLAKFSAIAGLGALVWLLFIATFVYTLVMFLRGRKAGRFPLGAGGGASSGGQTSAGPDISMTAQQHQYPQPGQKQQQHEQHQQHPQQPVSPQQTGDYQPTPVSRHHGSPIGHQPAAQSPYQPLSAYPPPQAPQDPQTYHNPQTHHNHNQHQSQHQSQHQPASGHQPHHVYQGGEPAGTPQPQAQQYHASSNDNSSSAPSYSYQAQELSSSSQQH